MVEVAWRAGLVGSPRARAGDRRRLTDGPPRVAVAHAQRHRPNPRTMARRARGLPAMRSPDRFNRRARDGGARTPLVIALLRAAALLVLTALAVLGALPALLESAAAHAH